MSANPHLEAQQSEMENKSETSEAQWMHEMKDRMDASTIQYAAGRGHLKESQQQCVQEIKADGNAAFKKGDIAAAVDFYSQAIDMDRQCGDDDEKTAVLYTNRAAAYLRQAEVGFDDAWEKVERDCRRAIERHPTAKAYMRCARALTEGLDRHGDALCCLAEALVLEPRSTAVQEAVGNLRVEHTVMSDHPQVLQSVEKLRKRQQMRERMDHQQEAQAYADAIALLTDPDPAKVAKAASEKAEAAKARADAKAKAKAKEKAEAEAKAKAEAAAAAAAAPKPDENGFVEVALS